MAKEEVISSTQVYWSFLLLKAPISVDRHPWVPAGLPVEANMSDKDAATPRVFLIRHGKQAKPNIYAYTAFSPDRLVQLPFIGCSKCGPLEILTIMNCR